VASSAACFFKNTAVGLKCDTIVKCASSRVLSCDDDVLLLLTLADTRVNLFLLFQVGKGSNARWDAGY